MKFTTPGTALAHGSRLWKTIFMETIMNATNTNCKTETYESLMEDFNKLLDEAVVAAAAWNEAATLGFLLDAAGERISNKTLQKALATAVWGGKGNTTKLLLDRGVSVDGFRVSADYADMAKLVFDMGLGPDDEELRRVRYRAAEIRRPHMEALVVWHLAQRQRSRQPA